METIAERIYGERYAQFREVLTALQQSDTAQARNLLKSITERLETSEASPERTQASFFLTALEKRLTGELDTLDNLYLLPDHGQQIEMFNFMAQKFPVVRYAQELVNRAYVEKLKGQSRLVLWDIGIGNGQQAVRLIEALIQAGERPERVQIIGLEPSPDSLENARNALESVCATHQLELEFLGIPKTVEALTSEDWAQMAPILDSAKGQWIANASFALHHIRPVELRTEFFKQIHAYQPALFCLIEPYSDFLAPTLEERFENAWHHYGLAFWAIDQIDAPLENRNLLKAVFFGREILDVIAQDEGRIEQFETGEMWTRRLENAGFQCAPLKSCPSVIPGFEAIAIQPIDGFVGLLVQGYPVISILSAH